MGRFFCLTVCVLTVLTASAPLALDDPLVRGAGILSALDDDLARRDVRDSRADTIWFGGDDGSGHPLQNAYWDFETPGSNGFQGCRSFDQTADPGTYFARVTAADFTAHGDPCVPMIAGTTGMLWCGIHEDEAIERDFLTGMGYQNSQCQRAFSPYFDIDPAADDVDVLFDYFNHTEPEFDYTYLCVLCYDDTEALVEEYLVTYFDGVIGEADLPATYDDGIEVPAGALPLETTRLQIEFRMESDLGWSDEDGLWDSPCGPFAADDVTISVGASGATYDFDDGPQGWTFERCAGVGAYMHIVHDYEYEAWLDDLGLTCECSLTGNAVAFVGTVCQNGPGLLPGQNERFETGVLARGTYQPPYWNSVLANYDAFLNFPHTTGSFFRPGYRRYPYTTEINPATHWSPRAGQELWYFVSPAACVDLTDNLTTMADDPLPTAWDSLRFVLEVWASCDAFAIPPTTCLDEGCTAGAPVFDNLRIGLTNAADAPPISWVNGGLYHDVFGQDYPTYLEPSDRCNANISYDLSREDQTLNDWHGDSSVVVGPTVSTEAGRWLCELCFKVERIGARQHMIPEYHTWKARLAGDPEQDFICVLLDSLETINGTQIWKHKFASYFHEDAVGFQGPQDFNEQNEILPDRVFVPGTRVEYYWRSFWFNGGVPPQEYYYLGAEPHREFECLPTMEVAPGEEYAVQWPSVLYVDAYNFGGEQYMLPALEQLGIDFDKFDYLDTSTNYNCSMKRDLGGGGYNPGGYGNNGCTTEQLLGYRLIILNTGNLSDGSMEPEDFDLFDQWLATTDCGLADTRRGFIFDGDEIAFILADELEGLAIDFAHNVLGVRLAAQSYRDLNEDPAYCVFLDAVETPYFTPADPGLSLYGNGCPNEYNFNVLGVQPGVPDVAGNLSFWSHELTGNEEYVDFAQVVRVNEQTGMANWRTVVNGFSFHHLSEPECLGEPCSNDSICHVEGTSNLYGPMLEWMASGAAPFHKWLYPCFSTGVGPEAPGHVAGPVTYLHAARPNPFHTRATIRLSLASRAQVRLSVFDVSGRLIRTLIDAEKTAGEHTLVWDGTDDHGRRVSGGLFWMQMTTPSGFSSGKKLLLLR